MAGVAGAVAVVAEEVVVVVVVVVPVGAVEAAFHDLQGAVEAAIQGLLEEGDIRVLPVAEGVYPGHLVAVDTPAVVAYHARPAAGVGPVLLAGMSLVLRVAPEGAFRGHRSYPPVEQPHDRVVVAYLQIAQRAAAAPVAHRRGEAIRSLSFPPEIVLLAA